MKYFYASRSPILLGQQIRPWGFGTQCQPQIAQVRPLLLGPTPQLAIDQGSGVQDLNPVLVIEVVFEDVRLAEFAGRPSRWDSVHLFELEADAVEFALKYPPRPYIYEVSVSDAELVLRADQILVNEGANTQADPLTEINQMRDRARKYWSGHLTRNSFIEVLVPAGQASLGRLVRLLDRRISVPTGQSLPTREARPIS